ncbi:Nucleotidyltransferase domain-containing protein [Thalassobacillus cyri]|uniref:Nucleotidyltransferase domain-containing protein n=1 Tax=Thalassobacillus cyri TaxID=571932 RepID=A0A1H3XZU9_9BACI|nr:nucleotidyltransferase domain-containing protein [Thalassobacillus cyri]SEA04969.1 Nucleotidyltransferase domain-containing protein [Thalassobacillus cyri]
MDKFIIQTATRFIEDYFPDALVVFIGGSTVEGNITSESDIDLVIIDNKEPSSSLECHLYEGWKIEAFLYHPSSVSINFEAAKYKGLPTLVKMCAAGKQITGDKKEGRKIKDEAQRIYKEGPSAWTQQQIDHARYTITDLLSDFRSATNFEEEVFIVHELISCLSELILRGNKQWIGWGKWYARALRSFDPELARRITAALEIFIIKKEKEGLCELVHEQLEAFGGEKFSDYREEHL